MQLQTAEDCSKCAQRQQEMSGRQWSCATSVGRSVPPTRLIAVVSESRHHSHGEARPQGKMALDRGDSDRPAPPAGTWYVQELVTNGAPVGVEHAVSLPKASTHWCPAKTRTHVSHTNIKYYKLVGYYYHSLLPLCILWSKFVNPLKCSGVRQLLLKVFSAIQV